MKIKIGTLTLIYFVFCLFAANCADAKCIQAVGEAAIKNGDVYSAKEESIARAKWDAVQKEAGIEIKGESIVQNNMRMVDEATLKKMHGVIKSYKVLHVEESRGTIRTLLNVCVEPAKAMEALSSLSRNSSILVFVPAKKPAFYPYGSAYEETNLFTEAFIEKLTELGYAVHDIMPIHTAHIRELDNSLVSGNFITFKNTMYRYLSNVLIVGKIDYTRSTRKGDNIGYGMTMPFEHVTARLIYRVVRKDAAGRIEILTAGTEQGKGLASGVPDAIYDSLKDLSEKAAFSISDKLRKYFKGIAKKIHVKVENTADLTDNFEIKSLLQNIAWVTGVDVGGLGEFLVSYPENSIYLANSLVQKGAFRLVNFSPSYITVHFDKNRDQQREPKL